MIKSHAMKKITLALMALLTFTFSLKAQQYVSTQPSNRGVILEEFTGRTCTWCPSGHVIANGIKAAHPDQFWSINIHSNGWFSATTYPNLNTEKGNQIRAAFNAQSFPSGVVNRSTAAAVGRGEWVNQSNTQFNQAAECNMAGMVVINPDTRVATITVEVYYTANSSVDENYLTVCMVQDSIWGSQTGGSDNPAQWVNGQYCHMHVFRDIVTNTMGDAIAPTTQGSLITRTYEYSIPEMIGSPNGVEVDLNNIHFLAWVSERYQGTPTRPILTACELEKVQGSNEPIYPYIKEIAQQANIVCSHSKVAVLTIQNLGTNTITSMSINAIIEGVSYNVNWDGSMAQYATTKIELPVEVPFGNHVIHAEITEANGQPFSSQTDGIVSCPEWVDHQIAGQEEEIRLNLMQDKYGAQITWDFKASDGTVLASGGPYSTLPGGTATQIHVERVTIPANDCILFTIHDSGNDGICCDYGNGYFTVKDSQGNVLYGDQNDGGFGAEASFMISTTGATEVEVGETFVDIFSYSEAYFVAPLTYTDYPDEVGFVYRKVTSPDQNTVVGNLNEFSKIMATVDDLEHTSIYMVKAYAIINGDTYYGPETTFNTWTWGVDELEQTLKIYPNPTSEMLNVQAEGMTRVEVYNALGQQLLSQKADGNTVQINTESLNGGVYFLRIYANDGAMLNRTFSVAR